MIRQMVMQFKLGKDNYCGDVFVFHGVEDLTTNATTLNHYPIWLLRMVNIAKYCHNFVNK
jgi:hypothetical protein